MLFAEIAVYGAQKGALLITFHRGDPTVLVRNHGFAMFRGVWRSKGCTLEHRSIRGQLSVQNHDKIKILIVRGARLGNRVFCRNRGVWHSKGNSFDNFSWG